MIVASGSVTSTSPSSTAVLSCPDDNGATYTTSDGAVFEIVCYLDDPGTNLEMVYESTLVDCVEACDSVAECVGFVWQSNANGYNNPCYLKSAVGIVADDTIWGGILVTAAPYTLSCPASNGTEYTTSDGKVWDLECYTDHSGGDLSTVYVESYLACVQACDTTSSCVGFSWASTKNGAHNPCYLKSSIGAAVADSHVWGGILASDA